MKDTVPEISNELLDYLIEREFGSNAEMVKGKIETMQSDTQLAKNRVAYLF
jgi:hypothetical protein